MKRILGLMVATACLSTGVAHADICADLRTVHTQSLSHFDGWKVDTGDKATGGNKLFGSNFVLDGASTCSISGDSRGYSCMWKFPSAALMRSAYVNLVTQIKACAPLQMQQPGILNDQPEERNQGELRQRMEITGFDYADAQVVLMVGQMQITGANPSQSRNELKLSFVKADTPAGK